MKIYYGVEQLPKEPIEPIATLGNLDGVHRGHQVIISELRQDAERVGAETMVITFSPHTRQVIRPEDGFRTLMTDLEKLRRLKELGVDHVLVLPFAEGIAEITADEFVDEILWGALKARKFFVGEDCSYGKNRAGDARTLASAGRRLGFFVQVVDPLIVGGVRVSSSAIRQAVMRGDFETARRFLGRDPMLSGEVLRGRRVGRELGYPTANLRDEDIVLPPNGVYAAWALTEDGARHGAMLNIGVRPTFGVSKLSVEAHLFDFQGDLYGQNLRLLLKSRLRDEQSFSGPAALKAQLKRDAQAAKAILS